MQFHSIYSLFISDVTDFLVFTVHIPVNQNLGQQQAREQCCNNTNGQRYRKPTNWACTKLEQNQTANQVGQISVQNSLG